MLLNIRFSKPVPEDAVLIAEAFGVSSGLEKVVVDKLEIVDADIDSADIIYITGESGSGKSVILRQFGSETEVDIPNEPICNWGLDQVETLRILSMVGLGDASLFLNNYWELSDSQQARARMALMILSGSRVLVIDEFLSTLDRETAQAVSFMFAKNIRRMGLKAIIATAHTDLVEYLQPDIIIQGTAFPSEWQVCKRGVELYNTYLNAPNLKFEYVDKVFYRQLRLGELHYKGKYTGGVKEHLAVFLGDRCIGILVATNRMHDDGRRIARVVIHPSYRGCGIAVALVKKYLTDFPKTDVVAAMALFNPIFEKAGMVRAEDVKVVAPSGLEKTLVGAGFSVDRWFDKEYCEDFCSDVEKRKLVSMFANHANTLVAPGGKRLSTEEIAEKIVLEPVTAGRVLWGLRPRKMAKYKNVV